jgi:signal transduction histidine kinase
MALDLHDIKSNAEQNAGDSNGGNLLSLASHELRTPLSIVKWYTEMLLDGDAGALTDDQTKYLRTIQTSNQRAIDLIRSLLNVSRLDLGTFSINPSDTDLRFLVKQIITEQKVLLDEKKITVEEVYGGAISGIIPTLLVDKQICLVMLRIIITNAILFSKDESSITVEICEKKQGEEYGSKNLTDDSLVVSVTDYGIGIPEGDKSQIFSKFFKASNAINEDSKGAGLGLYIISLILAKTGGEAWFTSEQNVGSTFYIAFPKSGMPKKEGRTTLD